MTASEHDASRGTPAAQAPIVLRDDVFDALTAKLGASNEIERARLIDVDRATLYRMRQHRFAPRLEAAMRMAEVLGTTVDELFERAAA